MDCILNNSNLDLVTVNCNYLCYGIDDPLSKRIDTIQIFNEVAFGRYHIEKI